jgi:GT2 family glycosyltransferase
MSINHQTIYTIVVTYNRQNLLTRCLDAILNQTRCPDKIIVVDNASTDGTGQMLREAKWASVDHIKLLQLQENIGGAGGFSRGIKLATEMGADFMWIMDDDALPEPDSLEILLNHASDDNHLYGSLPVDDDRLSWPLISLDNNNKEISQLDSISDVKGVTKVRFLPFLGMLISRTIVLRVGLPDEGFFLAVDDVEYCLRVQKSGSNIFVVEPSKLHHPAAETYLLQMPFKQLRCLKIPSWKRYYDVRNRLLLARKHYSMALYYQTIPGSFLRFFGTLLYEKDKISQTKAFLAGMVDGLLDKKGCRHEMWGL